MKLTRRHFLETAGIATAVGLAQPSSLFAQGESTGKQPGSNCQVEVAQGRSQADHRGGA